MANLQATTTSNRPTILPGHEPAVQDLLNRFTLGIGTPDKMTAKLESPGDGKLFVLVLYGCTSFAPADSHAIEQLVDNERADDWETAEERDAVINSVAIDLAGEHTRKFFEMIAPHLAESLHIQTVGHTKCRYPHLGYEHFVTPDGDIHTNQLGRREIDPNQSAPAMTREDTTDTTAGGTNA